MEKNPEQLEVERLTEIYKGLPPKQFALAQGLIIQAARLRVRLDKLWAELEEKGPSRIIVPVQAPAGLELPLGQTALEDPVAQELKQRLAETAVETMTPIEALNLLYELKQLL